MDERIQEAKFIANTEDSLEAWLNLEHLLDRHGESVQECFHEVTKRYKIELVRLTKSGEGIKVQCREAAKEAYKKAYGVTAGDVCDVCFRAVGSCSHNGKSVFYPKSGELEPFYDYLWDTKFQPTHLQHLQHLASMKEDYKIRKSATRMGPGAMVIYDNQKARAKFKDSPDKVPLYSYGTVFWKGDKGFGEVLGVEIDTEVDGKVVKRKFFSARANFSKEVLNAWYRYKGLDPATQAKKHKEKVVNDEVATVEARFGRQLRWGDEVTYLGTWLRVTWSGICRATGRPRIAVSPDRRIRGVYCYAIEVFPA